MDALLRRRQMMLAGGSPTPPAPLPYTPVEYIETDGIAYISTRVAGTPPRSSEIKVMLAGSRYCGVLCALTVASGYNNKNFALLKSSSKHVMIGFNYNYGSADGMPSIEYSIDNNKPFVVKTNLAKGSQKISVKQEDSDSWVSASKSSTATISSTYGLVIFNGYQNSSYSLPAPEGSRLYYCKIYSDSNYTTLIRDYVPCFYNGEYGLWDKVNDVFYGNAAGSGAFTGPQI